MLKVLHETLYQKRFFMASFCTFIFKIVDMDIIVEILQSWYMLDTNKQTAYPQNEMMKYETIP